MADDNGSRAGETLELGNAQDVSVNEETLEPSNAQEGTASGEAAESVATNKDIVDSRPKRNAKPAAKSVENHIQNSRQELEKLWGKVTSSISSMQTTQTSWRDLRLLIGEVRANLNTYKTSCVTYLDYLMNVNSTECREECEKYENIIDNHKKFVDTALNEANEHKKELMSELQSIRSGSRASSASSAVIRAQACAEAVAAVKKAEMQKTRSALVAQSTIVIEKEKAKMEQLYLEEQAAIAIAKANAIDDELGGRLDSQELDLPIENSGNKVEYYLTHQCDQTLSNNPQSPSIFPDLPPTTNQPELPVHESLLSKGITPPKPPFQNPDATLWGAQSQHEAPRMTQTVSNHLMQTSQPAPQHAVQSAVGAMCQPTQEDPQAARHDLSRLHAVPRQVVNSHGILYPPHPVPSSSQTHLVSSHLAAPLLQTSRNSTSHHPKH